ncbi:MAG TPA: ABC transporter permease [Acidimicrobiales bacterium]|nr:ABC transporter permease [Acidimicrobiales bacterium]
MTATLPEHATAGYATVSPVAQALLLARRSVVGTMRQPQMWMPSMVFPLMIAAVNSSAMSRSIGLPGFPEVDSFLVFLLPATIVQGVMFGAVAGGTDIALDIENGFFDRLVASPVSRISILIGRLSGAAVLGAVQAVIFMALFWPFGARVAGGPAAALVLVVLAMVLAIGIGGITAAMGLRTGSQEAVQNSFPVVFILLFVSSAFFPTGLMGGWYRTVAEANPLSWMIDGARHQVIIGFDASEAAAAIGIAGGFAVLTIAFAVTQLRRRLAVSS